MKKRVVLILTGILTFSLVGIVSLSSNAATTFLSQGRVEFNNGTPDNSADDVVFDVDDLKALDLRMGKLSDEVSDLEKSSINSEDLEQARQEGIIQTMVGTAIESQVLTGETFTNNTGVGLTGSMPNHGDLNWAPSSSTKISLQPGYYSGGMLDTSAAYTQGYVDGQNNVAENLDIQYTYHKHEGEASKGTGCYTKSVKHKHKASCYTECTGTLTYLREYLGESQYQCTECNTIFYYGAPDNNGAAAGRVCSEQSVTCGKTNVIESYDVGCGKTEDTVESAVIIYH